MTPEKLKEIEARCEAASEGPWKIEFYKVDEGDFCSATYDITISDNDCINNERYYSTAPKRIEDATFIAHARTDVPDLTARVRELEERIASAKSGLVVQHENAFVDPEDVRATIAILDGCNVTVDEEVYRLRAENKKLRVALGGIAMLTELIEDREDGDPILRTLRNTGCVARAALGGGDD